ncbi:MAG: hypothetical protein HKO66_01640, partial [Saprospiraceae bacterium]|nr:hypothetical protein [Saprospiraceae bacterium]
SKLTEKYEGQIDFCKDVIPEEFNSLRGGQEYFSLHCSHREMHKNLLLKFPEFKDLEKNQIKKVINAFYRDRQIPQPDKTYN